MPTTGRRWVFRLVALTLPLGLLLACELVLRWVGYGYPTSFLLDRQLDGRAVLTDNRNFGKRFFPPGLVRYPRPLVLPAVKPADTLRIFVFGESAALGDPDPKFGLPRMLEVLLRARHPGRRIEVVNAGMVAINSHVILPIVRDCARRDGDLWVIYMGNNEVIGPFGSASVFGVQAPALGFVRATVWFKTWNLGQLLDTTLRLVHLAGQPPPEWGGMEMMAGQNVRPDDPRARRVQSHFDANLRDILDVAREASVPVILCTVATNVRDCAPFASLHRTGLSSAELARFDLDYHQALDLESRGRLEEAQAAYSRAAAIDAQFADLAFRWGTCCLEAGHVAEARTLLNRARDLDGLQFRTDSNLNEIIRRAARERAGAGVQLLDAERLFAESSPGGLAGTNLFYEHVHLNPDGNYLLARAVAERAAETLRLAPPAAPAAADATAAEKSPARPWLPEPECLERIGLVDWNRYHILEDLRGRVEQPPFTRQVNHSAQLQALLGQLERYRPATKGTRLAGELARVAQAAARDPDSVDLHWNLAELYDATGNAAQAEREWQAVIQRHPHTARPRYHLASLLESHGDTGQARRWYEEALRVDPEELDARLALAALLDRQGNATEALRHLRLATRQNPRSVKAHLALGDALTRAGEPAAAAREFRDALRLDPGNPLARKSLEAAAKAD